MSMNTTPDSESTGLAQNDEGWRTRAQIATTLPPKSSGRPSLGMWMSVYTVGPDGTRRDLPTAEGPSRGPGCGVEYCHCEPEPEPEPQPAVIYYTGGNSEAPPEHVSASERFVEAQGGRVVGVRWDPNDATAVRLRVGFRAVVTLVAYGEAQRVYIPRRVLAAMRREDRTVAVSRIRGLGGELCVLPPSADPTEVFENG